jgi:ABC-type polysaccharide/polyol phosphate export permease
MATQPWDAPVAVHRVYVPTDRRARVSEVWSSWRVSWIVAVRDMRIKYKQSFLGPVWLVVQPLGMLAGVAVAFAGITRVNTHGTSYVLFAMVGVTVWAYVQLTIATAVPAMLSNAALVRRSVCPRVALVNGALLANLPTLGVMALLTLVLALAEHGAVVQMLLLPAVAALVLVFTWGPCLLLASVAARYRDAVAIIPLLVQGGLFLSPVGYPTSSAHGALRTALSLNPVSGLIEAARWVMLGVTPPALPLAATGVWMVVLSTLGWWVFTRLETRLADFL